jgi:type IV pilus assembly protein PilN
MIRVNLLTTERKAAKKKINLLRGNEPALGALAILAITGAILGWRYWALDRESKDLEAQISAAQQQTAQLRVVIQQVQQYEDRRKQLQNRVELIEQLRSQQTGPVHLLDEISRSLPPALWLTELKQGASADDVLIEGRCTTLTGLSDFVGALEQSGYFKRSIEIVSTVTDTSKSDAELIKFQIKAVFQKPGAAPAVQAVSQTVEGKH